MGQISSPQSPPSIILSPVDRLLASNADGGLSPLAAHIVLLGEAAGRNMGALTGVYVIGWNSLAGGLVNVNDNGTVVYGANNLSALTNVAPPIAAVDGPLIAIGNAIAPSITGLMGSSVLIGAEIANDAPALQSPFDSSVIVGNQALERQRTLNASGGTYARSSVLLGYRVLRGAAFTIDGAGTSIADSIFIGSAAGENAGFDNVAPGTVLGQTIAIGVRALRNINGASARATQECIAIGHECALALSSGQRNVWLGSGILTGAIDQADDVAIGANVNISHAAANGQNVVIGSSAGIPGVGGRCVAIGSGANATAETQLLSDHLLIETVNLSTGVRRNLIYGNMGTLTGAVVTACGLVLGRSSGTTRDLPGMNIVKLIDGSAAGASPVGGGFFYSATGQLHWMDTNGADHILTTAAAGFLVAALPAGFAGQRTFVTDALAPAFGVALVGGGGVTIPAFFNGAAWIAA